MTVREPPGATAPRGTGAWLRVDSLHLACAFAAHEGPCYSASSIGRGHRVAHPRAGGRGDGQRAVGVGIARPHQPREELHATHLAMAAANDGTAGGGSAGKRRVGLAWTERLIP